MVHVDHLYVGDKNVLHDDYEQIPRKKKILIKSFCDATSIRCNELFDHCFLFTFLCCRKTCKGYSLGSNIRSV
jgi:hypothetical protein